MVLCSKIKYVYSSADLEASTLSILKITRFLCKVIYFMNGNVSGNVSLPRV